MRLGFWHAAALSVAAHALVLAHLRDGPGEPAPAGARSGGTWLVTLRAPAAAPVAAAERPPARQTTPAPAAAPSVAPQKAGPSPSGAQVAAAPPTAQEQASAPVEVPYLPRGQLTVPPRVLGMVNVPFPDGVTGVVDLRVQFTLFIDEAGVVQRIRVDTPDVHPAFDRALRETFAAARFAPGELDGVPVRSQMRLEVEFSAPSRASAGSRPPRS